MNVRKLSCSNIVAIEEKLFHTRSFFSKVMRRSRSTNKIYTSSLEVNSSRRRWDATVMYGRMFDDDNLIASSSEEDYKKLILLRQLSDKAVRESNESAFVVDNGD